ncbi:MAG: hypothetical protein ACKPKO_06270 [Candidatus Fonsibacter sp.]
MKSRSLHSIATTPFNISKNHDVPWLGGKNVTNIFGYADTKEAFTLPCG